MSYIFRTSLLFVALLIIISCKSSETEKPKEPSQAESSSASTAVQQNSNQSTLTPAGSSATKEQEKYFADIFTKSENLSYQGYDIEILKKSIIDKAYRDAPIDVTYAVVKKGSKVLGKFDSVYFGAGNATNVGLFNFLDGQTKELAISQTISRGGRHWVVRLIPDYKVIFDSANYEVGREEVEIMDIDHDGIYEIGLEDTSFYSVFDIPMSETPLPYIIFKYDKKIDRYLPANHLFQDYLLQGIDKQISELSSDPKSPGYLSSRLVILLDYLYAGKEKEGWAFFDQTYTLPDKELIKTMIKTILKKGCAFQVIKNPSKKRAG
jgi:hypothetical protein